MKTSIALPQVGALADPAAVAEVARLAEDLGYDGLWVLDRLLWPLVPSEPYPVSPDGALPPQFRRTLDPLATLTFAAAHTTTVGIGTSVLAMPWYNPIVLARQLATIDVLSGGRLSVGLGVGWSSDEHRAAGAPSGDQGRRADEFLDTLIAAWTSEVVEVRGRHVSVPPSIIDLKPVSRPHPPVYLAAYAPGSMQRVARRADGWNPAGLPISVMAQMFRTLQGMAEQAGRDPGPLRLVVRANVSLSEEALGDDRPSFAGTRDQIVDDVQACRAIGAHEVILDAQFSSAGASPGAYTDFIGDLAVRLEIAALTG